MTQEGKILKALKIMPTVEVRLTQYFYRDVEWISFRMWVLRRGKWIATRQGLSLKIEYAKPFFDAFMHAQPE